MTPRRLHHSAATALRELPTFDQLRYRLTFDAE